MANSKVKVALELLGASEVSAESAETGSLAAGEKLHRPEAEGGIPANKWCVTKEDLCDFKRIIADAIKLDLLRPTERNQFDVADFRIGPNMHTVNAQVIKPVTRRAGGMSWALWLHEAGLLCDLFITHGWAEGAYEFLTKVLHSWPRHATAAYVCFLSNPQNLDIGNLIRTPSSSPFAMALSASPTMLVVPNESVSIYARLWCAYEAYLACSQDKHIFTAVNPVLGHALCRASMLIPYMLLAGATEVMLHPWVKEAISLDEHRLFCLMAGTLFLLVCFSMGDSLMTMLTIWGCAAVFPFALAYELHEAKDGDQLRFWITLVNQNVLILAAELGRYFDREASIEIRNLKHGFNGRIQEATCSRAADDKAIRDDIEKDVGPSIWQHVDSAIEVLFSAGKSTPDYRRAADLGVDLYNTGRVRLFPLFFMYLVCFTVNATAMHDLFNTSSLQFAELVAHTWMWWSMWWIVCCSTVVSTVIGLLLNLLAFMSVPDRRDFILNANGAVMMSVPVFQVVLGFPAYMVGLKDWNKWKGIDYDYAVLGQVYYSILSLLVCTSKVSRIAALGPCGTLLAQFFLPQGARRRLERYLLRTSGRDESSIALLPSSMQVLPATTTDTEGGRPLQQREA